MSLNEQERRILDSLLEWEKNYFDHLPTDIERKYDQWLEEMFMVLPEDVQEKFWKQVDEWIIYLQIAIQQSKIQQERISHIVNEAKIFNQQVATIEDLKKLPLDQLNYIVDQQISSHKLYSFLQGGISGSGHALFIGFDIPALLAIQLRAIQLIAVTYGYNITHPFELMVSLKLYHCATVPKRFQKQIWDQLFYELENSEESYFYDRQEKITDLPWLNHVFVQLLKGLMIFLMCKRKNHGRSILSMGFGAWYNYSLTKKITDLAKKFYQYRYLLEKEEKHF